MLMLPLGERLRAWRIANRLTAVRVAGLLGVSKVSVWSWERNGREPNRATRAMIENLIARQFGERQTVTSLTDAQSQPQINQLLIEINEAKERISILAGVAPVNVVISISY